MLMNEITRQPAYFLCNKPAKEDREELVVTGQQYITHLYDTGIPSAAVNSLRDWDISVSGVTAQAWQSIEYKTRTPEGMHFQSLSKARQMFIIHVESCMILLITWEQCTLLTVIDMRAWHSCLQGMLNHVHKEECNWWWQTIPWWRHQMETFSALLAFCAGNSPVTSEIPAQRPVTRSFGLFSDLRLNKRLRKQSWGWWFDTPSRSLWRHCNALSLFASMLLDICYLAGRFIHWQGMFQSCAPSRV